jgi:transcriptional regulator with XRE-family HTH domain
MPKKVTIHDVARHAGVSHTTVSWALHDDPRITDETKQKVLASVEALDYFPAFLGRSLVSGRFKNHRRGCGELFIQFRNGPDEGNRGSHGPGGKRVFGPVVFHQAG